LSDNLYSPVRYGLSLDGLSAKIEIPLGQEVKIIWVQVWTGRDAPWPV